MATGLAEPRTRHLHAATVVQRYSSLACEGNAFSLQPLQATPFAPQPPLLRVRRLAGVLVGSPRQWLVALEGSNVTARGNAVSVGPSHPPATFRASLEAVASGIAAPTDADTPTVLAQSAVGVGIAATFSAGGAISADAGCCSLRCHSLSRRPSSRAPPWPSLTSPAGTEGTALSVLSGQSSLLRTLLLSLAPWRRLPLRGLPWA